MAILLFFETVCILPVLEDKSVARLSDNHSRLACEGARHSRTSVAKPAGELRFRDENLDQLAYPEFPRLRTNAAHRSTRRRRFRLGGLPWSIWLQVWAAGEFRRIAGYRFEDPMQTESRGADVRRQAATVHTSRERVGAGKPLAPMWRAFLEDAFGCHLKQVRIHDGRKADALNGRRGSLAFARGENIFFRRGTFAPDTAEGLWLLAHELAHVLQQRGSCSSHVPAVRAVALEREASAAAGSVLEGRRAIVPPRHGCPSIQAWDIDMHMVAVYWTGRTQKSNHDTAIRVALASQSLDDSDETSAPGLKIKGRSMIFGEPGPNNSSSMKVRLANNSHALGVSYADSERVARYGIDDNFDLLFGLGLHTVGDYLAHANLSGTVSFGHGNQPNENCTASTMFSHEADATSNNPHKALDTIARFIRLWASFGKLNAISPVNAYAQESLAEFVMASSQEQKEAKFKIWGELNGVKKTEIDHVILLWNSDSLRRLTWVNEAAVLGLAGSGTNLIEIPDQDRRRAAEARASQFWLSRRNDSFFRQGTEVEVYQRQGAWGNAFGGYPHVVPPTVLCVPDPPLFPIVPYGTGYERTQ